MKLHWIQHVPFEGLGYIEEWAAGRGAEVSRTRLFAGEALPDIDSFNWLVIMGGPMGVHDHAAFPWLSAEKEFIKAAIDAGKTVLGICLGAQLMADALGAEVCPGPEKEIGWFPIRRAPDAPGLIPAELTVFHWHGDTFEIPADAIALATSEPGINQGFIYHGRVIGLQFHMETTEKSMEALLKHCGQELVDAPHIQSAARIRAGAAHIPTVNQTLKGLLDELSQAVVDT